MLCLDQVFTIVLDDKTTQTITNQFGDFSNGSPYLFTLQEDGTLLQSEYFGRTGSLESVNPEDVTWLYGNAGGCTKALLVKAKTGQYYGVHSYVCS